MPVIDLNTVPRRSEKVVVHRDGALVDVLVDDSGDAFRLNDTAYALWELCDGTTTVGEMVEAASELFAAPPDVLRHDVTAALQLLTDAHLIQVHNRDAE
jgi:hypothetical protein